ncbi:ABC transporter ATP-binding protein [Microbacterium protaetiae]|uniref:ABC transporter ATP-binding protein n=1 Tax=Microbacterium protaetiae TaxID=2509458 RepID=A0A4P6EBC5_9MICO|nr:ABC transporter ATP-binding protein [Microbacterium protaetiae]QAY58573.1 ABC transporter ATP-binding protein [Microbacterium protaetiae]
MSIQTSARTVDAPLTTAAAVRLEAVVKKYGTGPSAVTALRGIDLTLTRGSFTAIMGPSGSGKSTLLHTAAGLDSPTSGSVWIGDTDISRMRAGRLAVFRRKHVGFVFQAYNLLPALTVEENVTLPLLLAGTKAEKSWLDSLIRAVGLQELRQRRPAELSGGQQQRVAIARALITRPDAVFADEPTGALDSRTGRQVLELMVQMTRDLNQTVVMVTHDPAVAAHAERVIFLADGAFVGYQDGATTQQIADRMATLGEK